MECPLATNLVASSLLFYAALICNSLAASSVLPASAGPLQTWHATIVSSTHRRLAAIALVVQEDFPVTNRVIE